MYEMKRLLYETRAADYNNDPVSSLVPSWIHILIPKQLDPKMCVWSTFMHGDHCS